MTIMWRMWESTFQIKEQNVEMPWNRSKFREPLFCQEQVACSRSLIRRGIIKGMICIYEQGTQCPGRIKRNYYHLWKDEIGQCLPEPKIREIRPPWKDLTFQWMESARGGCTGREWGKKNNLSLTSPAKAPCQSTQWATRQREHWSGL